MKWKMVSNQNSKTIDNNEDNTFIESSEEKDTYLEYMIEKVLQKLDFKHKESCKVFSINEVADMLKVSKRTIEGCLLYTSPSPRDLSTSRMPSSA